MLSPSLSFGWSQDLRLLLLGALEEQVLGFTPFPGYDASKLPAVCTQLIEQGIERGERIRPCLGMDFIQCTGNPIRGDPGMIADVDVEVLPLWHGRSLFLLSPSGPQLPQRYPLPTSWGRLMVRG